MTVSSHPGSIPEFPSFEETPPTDHLAPTGVSPSPAAEEPGKLQIPRRFTAAGADPFASLTFVRRTSRIANPDGSVVFELDDVEVPDTWDQVSVDILASKYFRKAGVPQLDEQGNQIFDEDGNPVLGSEHSAKQVALRLANAWRLWGERGGYFASVEDAEAFRDEMAYMIAAQMGAPNTPAWFNVGIFEAYGIVADPEGNWYYDPDKDQIVQSEHRYERAAVNACFISSMDDELVGERSIFEFIENEARLFKAGSGSGANFSNLRAKGEPLSAGGTSSGVMSFLRVADRAAGAIKSGGSTRRAAKMVILDADHPEIEDFIWCKVREEEKVAALVAAGYSAAYEGDAYDTVAFQNGNNSVRVPEEFMRAVATGSGWDLTARTSGKTMKTVPARQLWNDIAEAAWRCADPGLQFDGTLNAWNTAADSERLRGTNPCFPEETLILTDKGLRPIGELYKDHQNGVKVNVWTHERTNTDDPKDEAVLSTADVVFETGFNPIVKLTFANGMTLRCTPNHSIFTVNRGYVPAADLCESDEVLACDVPTGAPDASYMIPSVSDEVLYAGRSGAYSDQVARGAESLTLPTEWTRELAHLLGWLIGDGSLTDTTAIWVYGSEADQLEVLPRHAATIESVFGVSPSRYQAPNGSLQLRISRKALTNWLGALGFLYSKMGSNSKVIPSVVHTAPDEIVGSFLSGLFDADGSVQSTSAHRPLRQVSLSTASAALASEVVRELSRLGIRARSYTKEREGTSLLPAAKGALRTLPRSTEYTVIVPWGAMGRFRQVVGFTVSAKAEKLADLVEHDAPRGPYSTKATTHVVSCEEDGEEITYNLTEPRNHSYIADGIVVKNCSEYTHVDDTACNLASLNAVKFWDAESQTFDVESYLHAVRLFTLTLEIHVSMSHYPAALIARRSYAHRTLGLGYCNVGALLMQAGLPYDSDAGRAAIAALTSLMLTNAYRTSAEIAGAVGVCEAFDANRNSALRVLRNHRRAAYGSLARLNGIDDYEELNVTPVGLDHLSLAHTPFAGLSPWVTQSADAMYEDVERLGLRNMQAVVIAPTGTIGLVMGADTTGIEPDFALVKMKKLAGGGYMQIVNQSVPQALATLGYDNDASKRILTWLLGTKDLDGDTAISSSSLAAAGFTEEEVQAVAAGVSAVTDLTWAFSPYTIGEHAYTRFGVDPAAGGHDLLITAGFSTADIVASSKAICGHLTVEGCPDLLPEHLPVFDCAVECGSGTRVIHWSGHVKALASVQPHVSGAISKTINMPNSVSVEEVAEAHELAYRLGVKCVAIYRDGSKLSQPLNSAKSSANDNQADTSVTAKPVEITPGMSPREFYDDNTPPRFKLPSMRFGPTWRIEVGGEEVYIRAGEYPDGSIGEVFVDWGKQGSTLRGITSALSISVSQALQHGVPLERIVKALRGHTFEPRGVVVGHENVKMATSIVDAIVRVLGFYYLGDETLVQVHTDTQRQMVVTKVANGDSHAVAHHLDDGASVIDDQRSVAAPATQTSERLYGESCTNCGGSNLIRAGSCKVCGDCGQTTGCS